MTATGSLRLAWWNTRLTLLRGNAHKRTRVEDPARWQAAASVVQSLGAEGKDVLVLGEITQDGANELANGTAYQLLPIPDIDARLGIAVLFRKETVSVELCEKIDIMVSDRRTKQSSSYWIYVHGNPPVCLIPSHWPARGQDEDTRDRGHLATDLHIYFKKLIRDQAPNPPYVVFCGDFNDEPFDASLTDGLRGTRDRGIARDNPEALYNPFWRLLRERECHATAQVLSNAGTYYCTRNSGTKWYTFDQFLVSPSFIAEESAWQLHEQETQVWTPDFLRAADGIAFGFDHYPVAITLASHSAMSATKR